MSGLKKIPFFLFLLVLFFCLHGSLENYGYIDFSEVMLIGILIGVCIGLFFIVVYCFTRNVLFAALTCFFVSLWYLFFGAFHDWIKNRAFLSFMHGYAVLLPLLLAASIAWAIYLRRHKASHQKWTFYLNLLLIVYCCIDGIGLMRHYFSAAHKTMAPVIIDNRLVKAKPNVYYLLFDEYPGYKSLKDSFAFANDSLYHFFEKNDFKLLPTHSNYDYTFFSMASILNMQYVPETYDPANVTQHDIQLRMNEIRHANVFSIFANMGYNIRNCSIFDVNDQHGVSSQNAILPVHSLLLTDKILHNRIIRNSGWLFTTGKWALPFLKKRFLFQQDTDNKTAETMVDGIAVAKKIKPVFVYAHFLMPHGQNFRDSSGSFNTDAMIFNDLPGMYKPLFISYLKYTNKVIMSMVNKITANDTTAIIIVMSDHGKRFYNNTNYSEPLSYDNICAVRFPDHHFIEYKEKWSTVNFFRYILNSGFSQNLPYLPDSVFAIKHTYY